jgi:hypothetical protein
MKQILTNAYRTYFDGGAVHQQGLDWFPFSSSLLIMRSMGRK